jgi:PAS domain-containing protein
VVGASRWFCRVPQTALLDYTGLTEEQALGWEWQVAIHPDDLKGLVERRRSSLASGTPVEAEARMRRFDGPAGRCRNANQQVV